MTFSLAVTPEKSLKPSKDESVQFLLMRSFECMVRRKWSAHQSVDFRSLSGGRSRLDAEPKGSSYEKGDVSHEPCHCAKRGPNPSGFVHCGGDCIGVDSGQVRRRRRWGGRRGRRWGQQSS